MSPRSEAVSLGAQIVSGMMKPSPVQIIERWGKAGAGCCVSYNVV